MARKCMKKGERGAATNYISRKQALKKLQLPLKDFRRLCILKGIYPVEPKHKRNVNHGAATNKTYYLAKDISFLSHEPIIRKFRDFKVFLRKMRKAIGKNDQEMLGRVKEREPIYKLDHIIKERYPTFIDAVRDLDDAVSMCFLFATFPKTRINRSEIVDMCRRVTVEFMHYVIESNSLRKVFISIKGYYYQADVMGQTITWVVPHTFGFGEHTDVDFKVMATFTDFYVTLLGFINFKLYNSINLFYPPKLALENITDAELVVGEDPMEAHIAALGERLKSVVGDKNEDEENQIDDFPEDAEDGTDIKAIEEGNRNFRKLFKDCKVFINREVPREPFVFALRSFGAQVSWDKTISVGSTFDETDSSITHHIVDRPVVQNKILNRSYVQPQWVFDCVNARRLMPVEDYFPGCALPAHLSPFVEEKPGDYVPLDREMSRRAEESEEDESEEEEEVDSEGEQDSEEGEESGNEEMPAKRQKVEASSNKRKSVVKTHNKKTNAEVKTEVQPNKKKMKVKPGQVVREDKQKVLANETAEEKRLAVMMIPKKQKRLYERIMFTQKKKAREVAKLTSKREEIARTQKKARKSINFV